MKKIATVLMVFSLAGCSGGENDDLKQFVQDSGKNLRGKVEALPEMTPYKAFVYNAFDLSDPFKPRKLKPSASGGAFEPDMNRPKEPLEAFSLESLKMVGVLKQKNEIYAVIKTPENTIYRVRVGDHLGQNFGKVLAVSDTEVKLKETVQDSAGDWAERDSSLTLQQEQ
ncbi:MAG: pilus assembly protein PilP [Thiotrichales bacterium]|jgi:type IV pilus assembly protein PilP|nr:pilus assembly protein PilP [Thiotrichales bacterium]